MKNTWHIILSMGLMHSCAAQTVTIDHEPAPVEYYRIPDQPLPVSYATYTADLSIPYHELTKTGLTESSIVDQYIKLEGYKKASNGGDVEIEVGISEFTVWGEHRNTRRTKTKDKDGKEHIKYSYSLEVKYSLPISLHITDKKGSTLLDRSIYSFSDTRVWTSPTYNSLSELDNYWRYQRVSRLAELHKNLMTEGLKLVYDWINNQFGYRRIKDNARFETIGKKKHPEYDLYQQNVEIIKNAFRLINADKGLDEVKTKINPALTFYAATEKKYKLGNKDNEKLKHICLYNLALAYFWIEEFQQATTYAEAIQKFNAKDKDARRLLEDIAYVQASLANANRPSRHKIVVGSKT